MTRAYRPPLAPDAACAAKQQMGGWWEDVLAGRCTFPIGPLNTWSNVAFLAAGWAGWALARSGPALVFALEMSVLAVGSALYHGFKTVLTDQADEGGMYLVLSGLATYALAPHLPWIAIAMAVVSMIVTVGILLGPNWSRYLDPLTGAFIGVAALALVFRGRYFIAGTALALLGAAFMAWHDDRDRTFPVPRAGHALWHLLSAAGLLALFLGLR